MDSQLYDRLEDALSEHRAVEDLAKVMQAAVKGAEEHLPPIVLSVLHGAVLGHPLHPALVHLPLGGWIIAGVLDFVPLPEGENGPEATEKAADLALLLGTAGSLGTLATGWTDWSNTRAQARRTGLLHGLVNETAFLLSTASLLARRRGKRGLGKALSGTGLILALAGGFLGGQLVYRHGLGVHRTLAKPQG